MSTAVPRVSVLLPVYNGVEYLKESIESVLRQSFGNFEIIAVDDGSTDGSGELLDSIRDARVRVIHQANAGLPASLNRAIQLARGEYLARQDADDICLPERFARQLTYLDAHAACAVVGTWSEIWKKDRRTKRSHRHPCENGELQIRMVFDSFFVHSSVMMRRSALELIGRYPVDPKRYPPEDFDLWSRIARRFQIANLPEVLEIYREVPGSISRTKGALLEEHAIGIALENIKCILGDVHPDTVLRDLVAVVRHAHEAVSTAPDWSQMRRVVRALREHFVTRFPAEVRAVDRGEQAIYKALRWGRVRRLISGGVAQRALGRLRRAVL